MGSEVKFISSRVIEGDKSRFKNVLTIHPRKSGPSLSYQLNAFVVHKLVNNAVDLKIDADATMTDAPTLK